MKHRNLVGETHAMYAVSLVSKMRLCFVMVERNTSWGGERWGVGSTLSQ